MDNLIISTRCAGAYVDDTDTYADYDGTETVPEHDDLADESADEDGPLDDHVKVIRPTAGKRARPWSGGSWPFINAIGKYSPGKRRWCNGPQRPK